MNFSKKALTALTLSSVLAFSAAASAGQWTGNSAIRDFGTYEVAQAKEVHPAGVLIREATENMLAALKANKGQLKSNPAIIYQTLENNILQHFDFDQIARLVLGRQWRQATAEQKERFTEAFRQNMVRTYASALQQFSDEDIEIRAVKEPREGRAIVQTRIKQSGRPPIAVDYRLYRDKNNEWKIRDVVIEGISLVMTHRSEYNSFINRNGLEGLLDALEQKNRQNPIPVNTPAP